MNNIFYMSGIIKMILPPDVRGIPYGFLRECQSLEYVEIRENVIFIGSNAFSSCPKLIASVIYAITPPVLEEGNFNHSSNIVYVPDESIEAYKSATNWNKFTGRIQPLSNFVKGG